MSEKMENSDPTLLKVLGRKKKGDERKAYVKQLANAILKVVEKHGVANLRAVGGEAVSNVEKSLAIAEARAKESGGELVETTSFTDVEFDGEIKTGILKTVFYR